MESTDNGRKDDDGGVSPHPQERRIGADEARQAWGDLIDRAVEQGERPVITRHEKPKVVVIGWREYLRLRALEDGIAA